MVQYIVNFTDPERSPFNVNSFTTDGPAAPNTLQLSSTAVRATTGLLLYGKGHPNYGERIQENLVNLMEHFSGATEPTFPISGQTWFARITYVVIGAGSPGTASSIFRWEDNAALSSGGQWVALTPTTVDPTTADEVKIGGSQPTTIVDGSFWFDTSGSPTENALYLGVNNSSSNLSNTFLNREIENLTGQVSAAELAAKSYLPQKQLKIYDGLRWKNVGGVFTSDVAPQRPTEGDLWFNTGQNDAGGSPQLGSPTNTPQNQLFIWQAGRWRSTGYVDTGGDVMTGTLAFGLPTSNLFIWENDGNSAVGSDIRFVDNGLLSSNTNLYIHIDNDSALGSPIGDAGATDVFEVATGSAARNGSQTSLFRVRANGVIETAIPLGSPEGSTYTNLILASGDANSLVHRAYVDDVIASTAVLTARVTENEAHIATLQGGGSPFEAKVNRSGDDITGPLNFIFGSPTLGIPGIDAGDTLIMNVQYPQAPNDAVNRQYVDDQLFGSPSAFINDGVVFAGTFDSTTNTLTLNRTEGLSDVSVVFSFSLTTAEVLHSISTPYLQDLFQETQGGSPLFGSPIIIAAQEQINNTAIEDLNFRLATTELPFAREVFVLGFGSPLASGGSPTANLTELTFTSDSYVAGTNRLSVFVNGVKQYADERAKQSIQFNTVIGLSSSSRTLLSDDLTSYTLDVTVDGGGPQTLTAAGNSLQLFSDIVNEINIQITGVTATWNFSKARIDVYSNTTGVGSAVDIADFGSPIGSSLLGALGTITRPGVGSPVGTLTAYTFGSIIPTAGGPITTVVQNFAYFEAGVGSPYVDATFGEVTSTIVFNAQQQPGDIVELIYEPVKE